jgi:hypothetical protein
MPNILTRQANSVLVILAFTLNNVVQTIKSADSKSIQNLMSKSAEIIEEGAS